MKAGTKVQCAWEGKVVPCEIVPEFLLQKMAERHAEATWKLARERQRHDSTLDKLGKYQRRVVELDVALANARGRIDELESEAPLLPTWVWWVAVAAAGAGGVWVGASFF